MIFPIFIGMFIGTVSSICIFNFVDDEY